MGLKDTFSNAITEAVNSLIDLLVVGLWTILSGSVSFLDNLITTTPYPRNCATGIGGGGSAGSGASQTALSLAANGGSANGSAPSMTCEPLLFGVDINQGIWATVYDIYTISREIGLLLILFSVVVYLFKKQAQSLNSDSQGLTYTSGESTGKASRNLFLIIFWWPLASFILVISQGANVLLYSMIDNVASGGTGAQPGLTGILSEGVSIIKNTETGIPTGFMAVLLIVLNLIALVSLSLLWLIRVILIYLLVALMPILLALQVFDIPYLNFVGDLGDWGFEAFMSLAFLTLPGAMIAGFGGFMIQRIMATISPKYNPFGGNQSGASQTALSSNSGGNSIIAQSITEASQTSAKMGTPVVKASGLSPTQKAQLLANNGGGIATELKMFFTLIILMALPVLAATAPWLIAMYSKKQKLSKGAGLIAGVASGGTTAALTAAAHASGEEETPSVKEKVKSKADRFMKDKTGNHKYVGKSRGLDDLKNITGGLSDRSTGAVRNLEQKTGKTIETGVKKGAEIRQSDLSAKDQLRQGKAKTKDMVSSVTESQANKVKNRYNDSIITDEEGVLRPVSKLGNISEKYDEIQDYSDKSKVLDQNLEKDIKNGEIPRLHQEMVDNINRSDILEKHNDPEKAIRQIANSVETKEEFDRLASKIITGQDEQGNTLNGGQLGLVEEENGNLEVNKEKLDNINDLSMTNTERDVVQETQNKFNNTIGNYNDKVAERKSNIKQTSVEKARENVNSANNRIRDELSELTEKQDNISPQEVAFMKSVLDGTDINKNIKDIVDEQTRFVSDGVGDHENSIVVSDDMYNDLDQSKKENVIKESNLSNNDEIASLNKDVLDSFEDIKQDTLEETKERFTESMMKDIDEMTSELAEVITSEAFDEDKADIDKVKEMVADNLEEGKTLDKNVKTNVQEEVMEAFTNKMEESDGDVVGDYAGYYIEEKLESMDISELSDTLSEEDFEELIDDVNHEIDYETEEMKDIIEEAGQDAIYEDINEELQEGLEDYQDVISETMGVAVEDIDNEIIKDFQAVSQIASEGDLKDIKEGASHDVGMDVNIENVVKTDPSEIAGSDDPSEADYKNNLDL